MKIRSYEDLKVWQQAMLLVEHVYMLTDKFPRKEQYRLVDQLCRAAVSVPSNIAEGSMRHTTKEYIRFIGIAQGSLAEVETQLIISQRLSFINNKDDYYAAMEIAREIGRMLNGLATSLARKVAGTDMPASLTLATSTSP